MELEKIKLYEAFGELLYAIAMVDGEVQESEIQKIKEVLGKHDAGKEIQWSFDYEKKNNQGVENAYKKAIDLCKFYGPSPDYAFLMDAVRQVADSSDGLSESEKELIERMEKEINTPYNIDRNKLK